MEQANAGHNALAQPLPLSASNSWSLHPLWSPRLPWHLHQQLALLEAKCARSVVVGPRVAQDLHASGQNGMQLVWMTTTVFRMVIRAITAAEGRHAVMEAFAQDPQIGPLAVQL